MLKTWCDQSYNQTPYFEVGTGAVAIAAVIPAINTAVIGNLFS